MATWTKEEPRRIAHSDDLSRRMQAVRRLPALAGFIVACVSFVLIFATAGTPIPLFNTYGAEDAITKGDLGMVSVGYFVAAATALLVFGRLSNHLGRRPVAIAALASALLSCVVLAGARGFVALMLARVLQGLACGIAPGALGSLRPRLQAPRGSRRLLLAAGAAFVATWSLGGFYQAFGPSVVAEHLGTTSPLVAATMFSSVMILNPVGGPATSRLAPKRSLRLGMSLFVVALAGILISLRAGTFIPLVAASLVVGLAQGIAATAALRALLTGATPDERAGLLATIYLVGYSGAAIPGIVSSKLAGSVELFQIAVGYAALGTIAALTAVLTAKNPVERDTP